MDTIFEVVAGLVATGSLVGLGLLLRWLLGDTPTERDQALAAKVDALKRANYLGAAYFEAQARMREEMTRARQRPASTAGRATVGRASVRPAQSGRGDYIDGEWHE